MSIVLSNHTSTITQLEYSSGVAGDAIANHTYEIADIKKNRQSDVAVIQAHYARIEGLGQADNESNAVLEIHADKLRNLGKGFLLSIGGTILLLNFVINSMRIEKLIFSKTSKL